MCPTRLFIIGEEELMGVYALGILPLLQFLLDFTSASELNAKEVAFANEFAVAGKLSNIKGY